ncbi:LysR family transcriptional regulator [uncultured Clostridium sp.]|uniref:LysR family transcriptional regulator n=1 Tax=uncultured Clostridium sp. TaxID=59620 RepID=UPI0025D8E7C6|nr:LysR family transcriptional regulator [uncultured Clostridium sp.]
MRQSFFKKAAEECFISQSAISQQIKSLEDELGVELFMRNRRTFKLTPAGEYFYKHCKVILKDVAELYEKTRQIEKEGNSLKIGYLRSYNGKELQEAVLEFSMLYPDIEINVVKGTHEELYTLLKNEQVSFVISDQRRKFHQDYINYHLLNMKCYIKISNQNPISKEDEIDVEKLKNETCIIVTSKEQEEIERDFYENIIGIKTEYLFVRDPDEAKMMVNINRGFMPIESTYCERDQHTSMVSLIKNAKQIQRNYCAFWKKDRTNNYIEEFVDILKKKMHLSNNE